MKTKKSIYPAAFFLFSVCLLLSCSLQATTTNYAVTTLANPSNLVDGVSTNARFFTPYNVVFDGSGNIYVADGRNNAIRKISSNGVVKTIAGNGSRGFANGTGTNATLNQPYGVAVDGKGNVYVADFGNNAIRKISSNGVVTTLAGNGVEGFSNGSGNSTSFNGPTDVTVDGMGNVYVADCNNNAIRKISSNGVVSTLAGNGVEGFSDGSSTNATFSYPHGVTIDKSGVIFVADEGNNAIRKITSNGVVTTFAGSGSQGFINGTGGNADFCEPVGVAVDVAGNVYVADLLNHAIRKISINGEVTTLAGNGTRGFANGAGTNSTFNWPWGVAVDGVGNIIVADGANNSIRKITSTGVVTTLAGARLLPGFDGPVGVATDGKGNVYVADPGNNAIRKITSNGVVTTFAGNGYEGFSDGSGTNATLNGPQGVAVDQFGNVYVADSGNNAIRKITSNGIVKTLAGNGEPGFRDTSGYNKASFNNPMGVAVDPSGNVYVADTYNNAIRKINEVHSVTTLTGNGIFNYPMRISIFSTDTIGYVGITQIFVADWGNFRICKVDGAVMTLAGGKQGFADGRGTNATFNAPSGVANDAAQNVYVADYWNNSIRKMTAVYGPVTTIAGNGCTGFHNGMGTNATFDGPQGVASDAAGNLYVADQNNNAIRKLTPLYSKSPNPITFAYPTSRTYSNGATFTLAADAPGGTVTFTSGNTNVITISGRTATINGAGAVLITANQAGNDRYLPATPVSYTMTVYKVNQTITFNLVPKISFATTKSFILSGSSSSGKSLTYTSSAPNIVNISGTTAMVKAKGSTTITATQEGDANYNAATSVAHGLTVQ